MANPRYNMQVANSRVCMKKGGKVEKVMREFKKGELNIGKSKKKVKSRKQAIAIALAEAGMSKKRKMKSWKNVGYTQILTDVKN